MYANLLKLNTWVVIVYGDIQQCADNEHETGEICDLFDNNLKKKNQLVCIENKT